MKKTIVFVGYFIIFFSILFLYLDYQAGKPLSKDETSFTFVIEKGQKLKEIGKALEENGLVKDKNIFILYTFLKNLRRNFLPGKYELKKNLSLKEVINILTSPSSQEKKITIIEGWDNNKIAEYLEGFFLFKKEDFLEKTRNVSFFEEKFDFLKDERIKSLEGFLFPDTYRLKADSDPEEIIFKMLTNFNKKLDENLRKEIKKRNKTLYEVIILASIIEKEVNRYEDKELVSDIFWRRLKYGIPLQADSTINYITRKNVRQATLGDIKIDSPYNTYKYKGLPPGPICNPGLDSIKAAIFPKENPYWYFLNLEDGTTLYSKTFNEHKAKKIKYLSTTHHIKELLVKYKNDEKVYKLIFDSENEMRKMEKKLKKDKNIEIVEPNYLFKATLIPNDPFYNEEWFLDKIGAPMAWDSVGGGSEEVIVALLDSGVDIDHPDLKENIWVNENEIPSDGLDNDGNGYVDDVNGWDFIENKPDPRPRFFPSYTLTGITHGTVVAGLIAAIGQNKEGIIGLAWKVKIMPIRVLNSKGEGSVETVIKGIDYAIKNKAHIINLSFVGQNRSELLFQAIKKAWNLNILIVTAAGNDPKIDGRDLNKEPLYPICLDNNSKDNFILGVTASDEKDEKVPFANYGNSCVDLSAPGTKIFSTLFYYPEKSEFKEYYGGYWSGTSIAVPLVSATAALIKSAYPLATNREIRNIILETVEKSQDKRLGRGRVNTHQALVETYRRHVNVPQYRCIVTAPASSLPPLVKVSTPTGVRLVEFYAYHKDFRGGVNLTAGDLNGDRIKEIITGAGRGGGPQVRVFDREGKVIGQFFAYEETFRGGINVAAGDLNNDGIDEIVVAPQTGSLPLRVFNRYGEIISEFYPYDLRFKGGVSLAVGDLDGDGIKEIITGAGPGGGPQVRVFDVFGRAKGQFFAYHETFRGGINVATGDLDGNGLDEIVVAIASKASPYLRIFDRFSYLKAQFLGYDRKFYHGVSLTVEDLDGDRISEIIIVPFAGGGPQVRIFNSAGEIKDQFFIYERSFNKGLRVTTVEKFE